MLAYGEAIAAYDEALGRAPNYIDTHNNKGIALSVYGDLLADRSQHDWAERVYGGHANISITLDRYSHVIPGMGDHTARAMEDALS